MDVYQTNYGNKMLKWPYEIRYDKETRVEVDVLVVGGGLAGGCAAMYAARNGASVAIVDKAPIERSGSGGAGIDHWLDCVDHPACKFTPEEYVESFDKPQTTPQHVTYIGCKENYNVLLDLEKLGLPIRDEDGEFEGAAFRDDETKLLFAYDHKTRNTVRLRGGDRLKPVINKGLRAEKKVQRFERVMITGILTEGGKVGARAVGATGFSMTTGEFFRSSQTAMNAGASQLPPIWTSANGTRSLAATVSQRLSLTGSSTTPTLSFSPARATGSPSP